MAPRRRPGRPAGADARAARAAGAAATATVPVADVKLELLQRTRPELDDADRNPFRFEADDPRRRRPPRRRRAAAARADRRRRSCRPGPPPPPPIPLRFIGLVDAPTQAGRVAILSDGRGNVFYGKEGDIIEGRYRVLKISPDAVELSYLDGRGRQTIRLSGQ